MRNVSVGSWFQRSSEPSLWPVAQTPLRLLRLPPQLRPPRPLRHPHPPPRLRIATASCTKAAISAAAMSATSVGPVSSVSGYGCSGSWAYANVVVGTTNSFDAVIVLQASGSIGPWLTVAMPARTILFPRPSTRRPVPPVESRGSRRPRSVIVGGDWLARSSPGTTRRALESADALR